MKKSFVVILPVVTLIVFTSFSATKLNAESHYHASRLSRTQANLYTLTKITDTTGMFQDFAPDPAINDNGVVAFLANLDAGGKAIVKGDGGPLITIADFTTNVPGFGTFAVFGFDISINSTGAVAFQGGFLSTNTGGVFTGSGGSVSIVGPPPPNPNVGPNFREPFIIDSGDVFMVGTATNLQGNSIYVSRGGGPPILLYDNSRLPNVGFPHNLFGGLSANQAGTVAFLTSPTAGALQPTLWFVFTGNGGAVTPITSLSISTAPDYSGTSINNSGTVAFRNGRNFGTTTIYSGNGGPLTTVADNLGPYGILAPNGAAINDDGMVVFSADFDTNPGTGGAGIFRGPDPVADKIIAIGDPLDGSTVRFVRCGRHSLNNAGQIAFTATLANGTQGVFRADPVNPNSAPVARCQDVTVSAEPNCTAPASVDNGSSDPDGDSITTIQSPPGPYPLGTISVTLTVTDPLGASSQCMATVTVVDTTAPAITTCPASRDISADANCQAVMPDLTAEAAASDNCSAVNINQSPAAGTLLGLGSAKVTLTARDAAGNESACAVTITIRDSTPPQITCPSNIIQTTSLGQNNAAVNYPAATATDNCQIASVDCVPPSGSTFPVGATTVNCTATDTAGNIANCAFTVTVRTPQQATRQLVNNIISLVNQRILSPFQGIILTARLQVAVQLMNRGLRNAAIIQLRLFIGDVNGLINSGRLSPSQGQPLIAAANEIIASLSP
jgi:hypothetical protein